MRRYKGENRQRHPGESTEGMASEWSRASIIRRGRERSLECLLRVPEAKEFEKGPV